jgi:hypothetical protein
MSDEIVVRPKVICLCGSNYLACALYPRHRHVPCTRGTIDPYSTRVVPFAFNVRFNSRDVFSLSCDRPCPLRFW